MPKHIGSAIKKTPNRVSRTQLVDEVFTKHKRLLSKTYPVIGRKTIYRIIGSFLKQMEQHLVKGDTVVITNYFKATVKRVEARKIMLRGVVVSVPPKRKIKITPAVTLKKKIANK